MTKLLIIVLAILLGVWLWRSRRAEDEHERKNAPPRPTAGNSTQKRLPQNMVSCDVCGLHLPEADALRGPSGVYCSAQHLQQAQR